MRLRRGPGIEIKTPEEFARMREAGLVVCRTLKVLADAVRPGITTADLDEIAAREIEAAGAVPSFLGYFGYPSVICTSVNEQIVHGIPDPAQRLRSGDIISIDCGAVLDGWHGDAALTAPVGEISAEDQALLDACETALWRGSAPAPPPPPPPPVPPAERGGEGKLGQQGSGVGRQPHSGDFESVRSLGGAHAQYPADARVRRRPRAHGDPAARASRRRPPHRRGIPRAPGCRVRRQD